MIKLIKIKLIRVFLTGSFGESNDLEPKDGPGVVGGLGAPLSS